MYTVEMISSAGEAVLTGLIEIIAEVLVGLGSALGSLDHYETNGALVDAAVVLQFSPVDATLMVGDIDAMNLITLGIGDCAVECSPP